MHLNHQLSIPQITTGVQILSELARLVLERLYPHPPDAKQFNTLPSLSTISNISNTIPPACHRHAIQAPHHFTRRTPLRRRRFLLPGRQVLSIMGTQISHFLGAIVDNEVQVGSIRQRYKPPVYGENIYTFDSNDSYTAKTSFNCVGTSGVTATVQRTARRKGASD